MKLGLNRGQVGIDVGMVVFEIVDDLNVRMIGHEFGALVEKSGVIFVGFQYEWPTTGARGNIEIQRHTTDQITRLQAGLLQDPGQHGGGRGFAVGAGHCYHLSMLQKLLTQPLWARNIGQLVIEDVFNRRITTTQCIADDDQIRGRLQLLWLIALNQVNAQRCQLLAHGRIDVQI
jgi:hypothetical protein